MISIAATPKSIKHIIRLIVLVSILSVFVESMFGIPLRQIISFNNLFYDNYFLWQPITAFFYIPLPSLAFGELLDAFFLIMLFWVASNEIALSFGEKKYFVLLVSSSLMSSMGAAAVMKCAGISASLSLLQPAILSLVIIWTMCPTALTPASCILFSLSPRLVLALALLSTVGYTLVSHEFARSAAYMGAFVSTYVIAVGCMYIRSPFPCFKRFDLILKKVFNAIVRLK